MKVTDELTCGRCGGRASHDGEQAEPAEGAGGVADLDVVDEDVPLGEENFPVVSAGTGGCGCGR